MRAYVFTDASLARQAGRFVWLDVDAEKAKNAPLRKQLPMPALPSYFIVDPATEKVALRWVGSATVAQLHRFLDDGQRAVTGGPAGADSLLARADRLYGEGDNGGAGQAYRAALAQAPPGWPAYPRAVEAALFALSMTDSFEASVGLARSALPRLRGTPGELSAASQGSSAAAELPEDHPTRAAALAEFDAALVRALADTAIVVAADDRSGAYIALLEGRRAAGDSVGAHRAAQQWSAFLDAAAARARTPEERAVFDSHRLSAYLELGQPERAVPMLQASERDLPDDYNPPARLAVAYRAMKSWDEALAASDRAMAKVYGPRRLLVLQVRTDIYLGRGEKEAAKRTVSDAIAYAEALPEGQLSERQIAALKRRLEGME
jgi:tetratricopeptide (TPR) repeat protein